MTDQQVRTATLTRFAKLPGVSMGFGRFGRPLFSRVALLGALTVVIGFAAGADVPRGPQSPVPGPLVGAEGSLRQTEAEAVTVAKTSGQPIEIGAFRSERRDVWANPDGTFTEYQHQQPVRTVKNHRWVTPDASLQRNADGSLSPRAATFGLRLSGGGTGPFLSAERAGRSMSLTWPGGPLPAPTFEGDAATYRDIAPGLDLVVNVGVETFSHVLVVRTPEAARRADVAELALRVQTKGLTVAEAGDGRLVAKDAAGGGRVFEAPQPVMWDSGDPVAEHAMTQQALARGAVVDTPQPSRVAPATSRRANLGVRVADGQLRLSADRGMLTDPKTRFPVYIDPVWSSTTTTFWAMVDSGYPNEEYPKFDGAFQTKSDERVGYCQPDPNCNNSLVKRLMYTLPASYSGKTILSAEFQVSLLRGWNATPRNIMLYRMGGGISAATNWNNMPAWSVHQQTRSLGAEQACSSTTRNSIFTATEAVQHAAANGLSSITFGLRAENEGNNQHFKRFCENALLKVNWNRAPAQPAAADLQMSPGGTCVSGTGRPYSDTRPVLKATLRDSDHLAVSGDAEDLQGQFRVQWTPPGGTLQTVTYETSYQASGTPFGWTFDTVNLTFPQNVVVSWDVRASDGTVWGPWSSDGTPTPCEFVYDNTTPTPPLVSSPEFLSSQLVDCATYNDQTWRDGVGVYSIFTFDSAATDVVRYQYGVNTNPSPTNVLTPTSDGGPVQLTWQATEEGRNFITVQAIDRANKHSAIATCTFRVSAGQPAVAEWSLADDDAGESTVVGDARGNAPATEVGSVTFGVEGPGGPADRAIRLPGSSSGYLATTATGVVDTSKGFSVSAWAKLATIASDQTVVSQDGSGEPGFLLGFSSSNGKWMFRIPVTDVESLGTWTVYGPVAVVGQWTHLVATYDPVTKKMMLHVDGAATEATRRSSWRSRGTVQIGRRYGKTSYGAYLNGDLADVALFNRVIVPGEVPVLAGAKPSRLGYWPLNSAVAGASPEAGSGQGLTLAGGAAITVEDPLADPPVIPMMGIGELYLDGADDYASTAGPVVATDGSFSVAARVRLASPDAGPPMTVVSQKGTNFDSGFIVRRSADNRWELALPQADENGGLVDTAADNQAPPTAEAQGQLLVLVYNAFTNEAVLYVDGQLAASARVTHTQAWNAAQGLQVGRAFIDGSWQEHLGGSVDEIRVYGGALDLTTVQQLNQLIELPDL